MSLPFSGCRSRSRGIISAIVKQIKLLNFKPLNKITVRFDPFHDKVSETRDFLFHLSGPKVAATNLSCLLKTEIVCDRSEPVVICKFEKNEEKLILKTSNLTALELLKIFNKHVSSRVKPATEDEAVSVKKKGKRAVKK